MTTDELRTRLENLGADQTLDWFEYEPDDDEAVAAKFVAAKQAYNEYRLAELALLQALGVGGHPAR